ncbi:MAG: hypothetical protein LBF76_00725 [Holosporales bacterium]|jgi:predicted small lipoprotein YifL|nr:hypothetical protein [Holosporales bacterium]
MALSAIYLRRGGLLVVLLAMTACGKRGTLRPPKTEPVPFPRQYPAPLTEEEINPDYQKDKDLAKEKKHA